jgi:multicomponent Na+:H+ antiporter subunit B
VISIPLFGKIHWTTAMLFDLGVFLAVLGSLLATVEVLGEQ